MTLVMTSLPLASVFQCLFTFAFVYALRWLAEIWQLSRREATGLEGLDWRWNSNSRDVVASSPSFSHPPPESPGELARGLITRPLLLWNWEISCEWQNHSLVSNKCLPSIISNLSNNKNKVWKTFGLASFSFKNRNCNLFQASCLSIYAFGIYFVTYTFFNALSGYIYLLLSFGSSNCLNFDEFGLLGSLKASIGCIWKEFYKFQGHPTIICGKYLFGRRFDI